MPQLVGLTEDAARKFLTDNGFTGEIDTSTREFSDTIPEGQVTAQDPGQGVQVPLDATITLTVSDGPEQRAVPDVTGKSAVEATSELVSAGFKVDREQRVLQHGATGSGDRHRSSLAGTLLDKDAVVTIRISQGIEQVVVPAGRSGSARPKRRLASRLPGSRCRSRTSCSTTPTAPRTARCWLRTLPATARPRRARP